MHRRTWMIVCVLLLLMVSSVHSINFVPREIYIRVAPAVVFLSAYEAPGTIGSAGTGSIITPEGLVLTNSHVVTNAATGQAYRNIVVCLKPARITGKAEDDLKQSFAAEVMARNPELDLALLKLSNAPASLPIIIMGDASAVSTGDPVAAIGHPEGGGLWILTTGTISGVKKIGVKDVFQTEASINRGNSGGPLLDSSGFMIGVNTIMVRKANDGSAIVGVNFAVKSTQVKTWLAIQGVRLSQAPIKQVKIIADGEQNGDASAPPDAGKKGMRAPEEQGQPVVDKSAPEMKQDAGLVKKPKKTTKAPVEPMRPERSGMLETPGDDLQEFKGPSGDLMYGIPEGKFTLDEATKLVFKKSRENAQKQFDELDKLEKEPEH